MKLFTCTGIVATVLFLVLGATKAVAAPYFAFYAPTNQIHTKEAFVSRLSQSHRIDKAALVNLYNTELGGTISPRVNNFDELLRFLRSDEVRVESCAWDNADPHVYTFSVDASGKRFHRVHRSCHPGEMVLSYRNQAIFSLYCGNLVHDPRWQETLRRPTPRPRGDCQCDQSLIHSSTYHVEDNTWEMGWAIGDMPCLH